MAGLKTLADEIVVKLQNATEDILKCQGGTKAAGTRVRKVAAEVAALAKQMRKEVLTLRDSSTAKK